MLKINGNLESHSFSGARNLTKSNISSENMRIDFTGEINENIN